jgi:hypothetical protein
MAHLLRACFGGAGYFIRITKEIRRVMGKELIGLARFVILLMGGCFVCSSNGICQTKATLAQNTISKHQKKSKKPYALGQGMVILQTSKISKVAQTPTNCETALAIFDMSIAEVRKRENTYLIIIARQGSREVKKNLTQRRLKLIREGYLVRFPDVKYVIAEGSRIKGFGVIELYVGGELWNSLPIKMNTLSYCSKEDAF